MEVSVNQAVNNSPVETNSPTVKDILRANLEMKLHRISTMQSKYIPASAQVKEQPRQHRRALQTYYGALSYVAEMEKKIEAEIKEDQKAG